VHGYVHIHSTNLPILLTILLFWLSLTLPLPAQAQDINSFRAKNGRAPLAQDASLTGLAYAHAADMARRGRLDHAGFARERAPLGARAENVGYGCADEPCAILQWSRSAGHRAAMLRQDISSYGLASVVSASGRRYWAMELGGGSGVPTAGSKRKRAPKYMEGATRARE
jgi:hypothetical protein